MHIMEAFLPLEHADGWTVASAPFLARSMASIKKPVSDNPEQRMLFGVDTAFAFSDPLGGIAASLARFARVFSVTKIPLAIGEGLLTVPIFKALARLNSEEPSTLGLGREMEAQQS